MLRKKAFWIILAVVLAAGGGYAAYRKWLAPAQSVEVASTVQTATVTVGNLSLTAAGSGSLVPSQEAALAFSMSGVVLEVSVAVGDKVQAGDVLARIDDASARQTVADAELAVAAAARALVVAVGEAELAVAQAEANLAVAQAELDDLLDWEPDEDEIEIAQANLSSAQISYQNAVAKAGMTDQQNVSTRINLSRAIESLASAQESYRQVMSPERDWDRDIETTRTNAAAAVVSAQQSLEIAQASYDLAMVDSGSTGVQSAYAQLISARKSLEELESSPDDAEITAARLNVQALALALQSAQLALGDNSEMAQRQAELELEKARLNLVMAEDDLEGAQLTAPFAGTVTAVNIQVGEIAEGTAMTLANLDEPIVQFWVEESDIMSVAVGNPVNLIFEALPDYMYTGEIYQIDPLLVTVGNTPAVQCWATIDTAAHPVTLLGDMNVEVDIVSGQATNALLVPVQALRELDNGQYAVFVVQPDGELELRLVEVGLQDYVNAVIVSGLEQGETVTLGNGAALSSTADDDDIGLSNEEFMLGPMDGGGMPPDMMGGGGRP